MSIHCIMKFISLVSPYILLLSPFVVSLFVGTVPSLCAFLPIEMASFDIWTCLCVRFEVFRIHAICAQFCVSMCSIFIYLSINWYVYLSSLWYCLASFHRKVLLILLARDKFLWNRATNIFSMGFTFSKESKASGKTFEKYEWKHNITMLTCINFTLV